VLMRRLETGGVQWMCAGRGIIHAEMPVHDPGMPDPRGLQLWIDLPKEFKMVVSCLIRVRWLHDT